MENKKEYRYIYANGDVAVLTAGSGEGRISEEWIQILKDLDRQEYNNIHTETRRHCSLNALDPDEYYLPAVKDGFDEYMCRELWNEIKDELTVKEAEIAEKIFIEGYSVKEVMALQGLDLTVERGELMGIVGASGSGKSTLLNIIGGIDNADAGEICIAGERMADMKERRLTKYRRNHLGYIFQMYNLIPNLTPNRSLTLSPRSAPPSSDVLTGLTSRTARSPRWKSAKSPVSC
mgnify:CR=1 FL=1